MASTSSADNSTGTQQPPKEYLSQKDVGGVLNSAIEAMLISRPDDVVGFLQQHFNQQNTKNDDKTSPRMQKVQLKDENEESMQSNHSGPPPLRPGPFGDESSPGDVSLGREMALRSQRRRSSLSRRGSSSGLIATNADRALATKTRYDDGINDVIAGAVRFATKVGNSAMSTRGPGDSDEVNETTRRAEVSLDQFLEALRLLCTDHKLPADEIVEAILHHLRSIDPNEWLSEVEVVGIAAMFAFSFETYRVDNDCGYGDATGRHGSTHRTQINTVTPPYWYHIRSRKRLDRQLSDRIEMSYRSIATDDTRLIAPLLPRGSMSHGPTPLRGAESRKSIVSSINAAESSSNEVLTTAQEFLEAIRDDTSSSLDLTVVQGVMRDLWECLLIAYGQDGGSYVPTQLAADPGNIPSLDETNQPRSSYTPSIVHFLGFAALERYIDANGGKAPTELELLDSFLYGATMFEVLDLLEIVMLAEMLPPLESSTLNSARGESNSSGADQSPLSPLGGTCQALVCFRDGSMGSVLIVTSTPPAHINPGCQSITRYAVPESTSVRSVLQACASAGRYSPHERLVASCLNDAITYHEGYGKEARDNNIVVYKVLGSYFSTSRSYTVGSVVTLAVPALATASRGRMAQVLGGCVTDNRDAPPPIKFLYRTFSVIPLGVHSMLPRAQEVVIPAGTPFLVSAENENNNDDDDEDVDTTAGQLTSIGLRELDTAQALNYQVRHMLKSAPSEISCRLVWDVMEGRRIIRLGRKMAGSGTESPAASFAVQLKWVAMVESVEIPLEDLFELLHVDFSQAEFELRISEANAAAAASASNAPSPNKGAESGTTSRSSPTPQGSPTAVQLRTSPGQPPLSVPQGHSRSGSVAEGLVSLTGDPRTEDPRQVLRLRGRYDETVVINLVTKLGKMVDADGSTKPFSVRSVPNSRDQVDDADVQFLCSLLKLEPVVQHVVIDGHAKVSTISCDSIITMLSRNVTIRSFQVTRCRIPDHMICAILVLSTAARRGGRLLVANGSKWQRKMSDELRIMLDEGPLSPQDNFTHPIPAGGGNQPVSVQFDPFFALSTALIHTTNAIRALDIRKGGDIALLFVHSALWEHVEEVTLDNVDVREEVIDAFCNSTDVTMMTSSSPVGLSPEKMKQQAHVGWSGLLGLSRCHRLAISNLENPIPTAAIDAISELIELHQLVRLELEEVQMTLFQLVHLTGAMAKSNVGFTSFSLEKCDVLPLREGEAASASGSIEGVVTGTEDELWQVVSKNLNVCHTLTSCSVRFCTGLHPLVEESGIRVTLRNRVERGELSQEDHDNLLEDVGLV